jgi:hypothetical protein
MTKTNIKKYKVRALVYAAVTHIYSNGSKVNTLTDLRILMIFTLRDQVDSGNNEKKKETSDAGNLYFFSVLLS